MSGRMTSQTADAINSLPDGVATDRTPRSTPAGVVASAPVGPLQRLDSIVRTGDSLSRAVDACSREQLRALADRFDLDPNVTSMVLRIQVKRQLLGAGGRVGTR